MIASVTNVSSGQANAMIPAPIAAMPNTMCSQRHSVTAIAVTSSPTPTRKNKMPA